jgi:citrate lyase gamma subunit
MTGKGINLLKYLAIKAEKDGETEIEKNALKLLQRLGISSTQIAALKKGELDLEEATTEIEKKFESSIEKRISDDIEKRKTKEIHAGVYDKTEKLICKAFGLNHDQYKDIDEKERTKTILADGKKLYDDKLEQFKGTDTEKLKEVEKKYQDQLDAANKEKADALSRAELAEKEADKKLRTFKVEQAQAGKIQSFVKGLKAPAFDEKIINSLIEHSLLKSGYGLDLEEGESGRIFLVDKDGKRVKSAKVASENLTLDEFLTSVAEEKGFEAKNNFGGFNGSKTGGAGSGAGAGGQGGAGKGAGLSADEMMAKVIQKTGFKKEVLLEQQAKGIDIAKYL